MTTTTKATIMMAMTAITTSSQMTSVSGPKPRFDAEGASGPNRKKERRTKKKMGKRRFVLSPGTTPKRQLPRG